MKSLGLSTPDLRTRSPNCRVLKPSIPLQKMDNKPLNRPPRSPGLQKITKTPTALSPCPCSHEKISEKRSTNKERAPRKQGLEFELQDGPRDRTDETVDNRQPTEEWAYLQLQLGLAHPITFTTTNNNRSKG